MGAIAFHDYLLNHLSRRRSKKTSKLDSLAFVRGIHRWPVNSPHKRPVTRKMFPFDDVIVKTKWLREWPPFASGIQCLLIVHYDIHLCCLKETWVGCWADVRNLISLLQFSNIRFWLIQTSKLSFSTIWKLSYEYKITKYKVTVLRLCIPSFKILIDLSKQFSCNPTEQYLIWFTYGVK